MSTRTSICTSMLARPSRSRLAQPSRGSSRGMTRSIPLSGSRVMSGSIRGQASSSISCTGRPNGLRPDLTTCSSSIGHRWGTRPASGITSWHPSRPTTPRMVRAAPSGCAPPVPRAAAPGDRGQELPGAAAGPHLVPALPGDRHGAPRWRERQSPPGRDPGQLLRYPVRGQFPAPPGREAAGPAGARAPPEAAGRFERDIEGLLSFSARDGARLVRSAHRLVASLETLLSEAALLPSGTGKDLQVHHGPTNGRYRKCGLPKWGSPTG